VDHGQNSGLHNCQCVAISHQFLLLVRYVPNIAKEEYRIWDQCKKYEYRRPTDRRPTTDFRAHSHILQRFQMAVVLGWGFRAWQIKRHHFRLDQIQDSGRRQSWKSSNVSATHYPIHCMYVHRPYFALGL